MSQSESVWGGGKPTRINCCSERLSETGSCRWFGCTDNEKRPGLRERHVRHQQADVARPKVRQLPVDGQLLVERKDKDIVRLDVAVEDAIIV